jgi:hypothetical protein
VTGTGRALVAHRRDLVAALATGLFVAAVVVPPTWHSCLRAPDTIDYLGIANAWVNGAGFVDPVKWNYYLAAPVPLPAFAVRAPVPPLLAAIPLALGGGASTIAGWHAALLAVSAAGFVLRASRDELDDEHRGRATGDAIAGRGHARANPGSPTFRRWWRC